MEVPIPPIDGELNSTTRTLLWLAIISLLIASVVLGLLFATIADSDGTDTNPISETESPDSAAEPNVSATVVEQAAQLGQTLIDNGTNASVYVRQNRTEILVTVPDPGDTPQSVRERGYDIAHVYADQVARANVSAATLTVGVGGVNFVVPSSTVRAHADGTINNEAFNETIAVE